MDARQLARNFRKEPTRAEDRIWQWLRDRRFGEFKFRRQHPVGGYILDFYCFELKLAIELDGRQHEEAGVAEQDGIRTARLARRGLEVVRIANVDLIRDPRSVEAYLRMVIERRRSR